MCLSIQSQVISEVYCVRCLMVFICRGSIDVLDRMSKAVDAICDGNLVEKQVRSQNNWNLLPTQVCTICV